ncbi:Uncharacterised protein [Mycobacteroides abscessus subsp. abscessus]|nr:Uncharacterised protein [Mycobacteroides abscessus subsp. abscessus]
MIDQDRLSRRHPFTQPLEPLVQGTLPVCDLISFRSQGGGTCHATVGQIRFTVGDRWCGVIDLHPHLEPGTTQHPHGRVDAGVLGDPAPGAWQIPGDLVG